MMHSPFCALRAHMRTHTHTRPHASLPFWQKLTEDELSALLEKCVCTVQSHSLELMVCCNTLLALGSLKINSLVHNPLLHGLSAHTTFRGCACAPVRERMMCGCVGVCVLVSVWVLGRDVKEWGGWFCVLAYDKPDVCTHPHVTRRMSCNEKRFSWGGNDRSRSWRTNWRRLRESRRVRA